MPRPLPRALKRPLLVLPVAALLLAVVAFEGYGAWTRSRPVDYRRGGGFAVGAAPTATGSPGAGPSSDPTADPTATATAPGAPAAAGSPAPASSSGPAAPAAGARATAEPGSPGTATAAPHVLALPRVGRYGLAVTGREKVDFGPVSFCSQQLPSRATLVVSHAAGEGPTSFDFDVAYFPGQSGKHDERHIYRYTPDAVLLDYEIATVTCQGVRQSSDTTFAPPQLRARLPLAVGARWSNRGGDAQRTETSTSQVLRTETVTVGGAAVRTYVISTTTDFTGSESGTRSQTWWYAPGWAMPVRWTERIDGRRSGAAYQEDVTVSVTSRP